jgi:hypothetical protein
VPTLRSIVTNASLRRRGAASPLRNEGRFIAGD